MRQLALFDTGPSRLDQLALGCADEGVYFASCPKCRSLVLFVDGFLNDPSAVHTLRIYHAIGRSGMAALAPQDFGGPITSVDDLDDERPTMHLCETKGHR